MAGLIDTSVLVEIERRRVDSHAVFQSLPDELAIASITAAELLHEVYRATPAERRARREERVEALLEAFPIVSFDLAAARVFAAVESDLAAAGQRIGTNDLMIAATALAHGFDVVTENLREFERVPGLVVRRPDWDAASG